MNNKAKSILAIVAHADDEVLGCGGTLARHVIEGDRVQIVFMADGVESRGVDRLDELQQRNRARDNAMRILGISRWDMLGFPDNRMDSVPLLDIVQKLQPIVEQVSPTRIYTHHRGDLNIDHRITHEAVMTVCRPVPENSVREILTFEVMSSTEWAAPDFMPFTPNFFVDISSYLPTKLKALTAYEMEMRSSPHSRCIKHLEALARHRGNSVGLEAAEAFDLIRLIQ